MSIKMTVSNGCAGSVVGLPGQCGSMYRRPRPRVGPPALAGGTRPIGRLDLRRETSYGGNGPDLPRLARHPFAMKFEELIVLLPCHSLEDFPLYYEGHDADSLLAGWTSLWHPALLAAAGAIPPGAVWTRPRQAPQTGSCLPPGHAWSDSRPALATACGPKEGC